MSINLDRDKCIGCGSCADSCPYEAVAIENGIPVFKENCVLCGICVDNCETGAISVERGENGVSEGIGEYHGVSVFAEQRNGEIHSVSYELLGIGRCLANELGVDLSAVLLGHNVKELCRDFGAYGADKVFVVNDPALDSFDDDLYTGIVTEIVRQHRPEIFLAGATAIGRSFIPRVATALRTGLTADCTQLAIRSSDRALLQTRPAFGGNVMATIVSPKTRPQMATVRPKVMKKALPQPERKAEMIEIPVRPEQMHTRVRLVNSVPEKSGFVNIADADVIVAGGRGLKKGENFAILMELAELLQGAVGGTRATVDEGWIPYACQIGQTGKTVSPKLYLACGVSGAVQHIVGMQSSDVIVAVNTDPEAPIFEVATFGIKGDLFEVIPTLTKRLRELCGK
ncbi:MAG: electron transfer flavoprotein subunit alpha [Pseudomonadota bacterium]